MWRRASAGAGAVAVAIGLVAALLPHLLLKVPRYGFVLWAMAGQRLPPFLSFDAFAGDEHRTWLRDGDLVVAVAAKSGTTWMLYCSHQIRTKASDEFDFGDVSYSTPWPEMLQAPGQTWEAMKALLNSTVLPDGTRLKDYWDHPKFPFRIFKSHAYPRDAGGTLPVRERPRVRYLAMVRNHLDQLASFAPFFDQHTDAYRAEWGGFPPRASGDAHEVAEQLLRHMQPGGAMADLVLPYVKGWWRARREPNVLLLHYADALNDLPGTVRALAAFLGVALSDAEFARVTHRCSMEHMRTVSRQFLYQQPLNARHVHALEDRAIVRRGALGDGDAVLNGEQKVRWRAVEEAGYADEPGLVEWVRDGRAGTSAGARA